MKKKIMQKKIFIALLTVALFGAGFAGRVYAVDDHQPVAGQKLIGMVEFGTFEFTETEHLNVMSSFVFTNPNCTEDITITQVSIIRQDSEVGTTLVYEGPFINVEGIESVEPVVREVVDRPMEPHEMSMIRLYDYMYTGLGDPDDLTDPANWKTLHQAVFEQPLELYTVEIFWEAKGKACPLIGWQSSVYLHSRDGQEFEWLKESNMVNMTQSSK